MTIISGIFIQSFIFKNFEPFSSIIIEPLQHFYKKKSISLYSFENDKSELREGKCLPQITQNKTKKTNNKKDPNTRSLIPYLIQNLLHLTLLREKCLASAMEAAVIITFSRLHKPLENLLCNKCFFQEGSMQDVFYSVLQFRI